MKRPHASSSLRSSMFVLTLVVVTNMARVIAQSAMVMRAESAQAEAEFRIDELLRPRSSGARMAAPERMHVRTKATTVSPEAMPLRASNPVAIEEMRATTAARDETLAIAEEAPMASVVVTGDHTFAFAAPLAAEAGTANRTAALEAPAIDRIDIEMEAPTTSPVVSEPPTPAPVVSEPPTPALVATEPPTLAPVATEPPTGAPMATEEPPGSVPPVGTDAPAIESPDPAPTIAPAATQAPIPDPVEPATPVMTSAPTLAPARSPLQPDASLSSTTASPNDNGTVSDVTLPFDPNNVVPEQTSPVADIETDPAVSLDTPTGTQPVDNRDAASNLLDDRKIDLDWIPELNDHRPDTGETVILPGDTSETDLDANPELITGEDGSVDSEADHNGLFTLSPITSDMNGPDGAMDTIDSDNSEAQTSHTSTKSGHFASFGGWKLALVIAGAVCAVLVSVYIVHRRHVRNAAANKRDRGSSQQRALDSFFRQNRVTIPRDTGVSSNMSVADSLPPRNQFARAMPSKAHDRSCNVPTSAAQLLNQRPRPGCLDSTNPLSNSYRSAMHDSNPSATLNSARSSSSNTFGSRSVFLNTGAAAAKGVALSVPVPARAETVARTRHEVSFAALTEDIRDTTQSSRSSGEFSIFNASVVSVDSNPFCMSTQLFDIPTELSEPTDSYPSSRQMSDDALSRLSDDESYSSELAGHDSFRTDVSIEDGSTITDSFASVEDGRQSRLLKAHDSV